MGKKLRYFNNNQATRAVQEALDTLQMEFKRNPTVDFEEAIDSIRPLVKVSSLKFQRKNIMVPQPLNLRQSRRVGISWITDAASSKSKQLTFGERIGQVMMSILKKDSPLFAKKDNAHKMALANRSNLNTYDRRIFKF